MASISVSTIASENTWVNSPTITPVSSRLTDLTLTLGYVGKDTDRRRIFLRFNISTAVIPKYSKIISASLNLTPSAAGTAFAADVYYWQNTDNVLSYSNVTYACRTATGLGICGLGDGWTGGLNHDNTSLNFIDTGSDITISSGTALCTTDITSVISDFLELRTGKNANLNILLIKQNESSSAISRNIHSRNAVINSQRPYLSFEYSLNNMIQGGVEKTKIFGGYGEVKLVENEQENNLPVIISVTGTPNLSDPTFINGIPIMTSNYGTHRAIHVYQNPDADSVERIGQRTVYNGVAMQTSTVDNINFYLNFAKEESSFDASLDRTGKSTKLGNLFIDNDAEGRILVLEKTGSPIEESRIYIGGNPVTVGRFSDGWALGIDY
jgi:hypothetical protein